MFESAADSAPLGTMLVTLLIGLCTSILLYWYSVHNHDYFKKLGIPYVKPYPFLGSVKFGAPMHETEDIRYKEFGPVFGHFETSKPLLSVADPALLREILVKDFQFFTSRRNIQMGDKVADSMLFIVRGEDWKRIRTIVTPTFSTGKIRRMMDIFKDSAKTLVHNFREASIKGNDIEAKSVYGAYTMDVIASSAFSTKIDSHNDPANPFVRFAMRAFARNVSWRFVLFFIAPSLMRLFRIPVFDPYASEFFKNKTLQIIKERKRTGQIRNDFLQLLIDSAEEQKEAVDGSGEADDIANYGDEPNLQHKIFHGLNFGKKSLSMDELISQCVTFFIAGFDTTASTLAFCSYQMALHQDVQDRVRREVDGLINEHGVRKPAGA